MCDLTRLDHTFTLLFMYSTLWRNFILEKIFVYSQWMNPLLQITEPNLFYIRPQTCSYNEQSDPFPICCMRSIGVLSSILLICPTGFTMTSQVVLPLPNTNLLHTTFSSCRSSHSSKAKLHISLSRLFCSRSRCSNWSLVVISVVPSSFVRAAFLLLDL